MTKKTTQNAEAPTEDVKNKKAYKVACGHFEKKKEAISEVSRAKDKGYKPMLIVNGPEFALLFGEYNTEQAAQENVKVLNGAGFEVYIIC